MIRIATARAFAAAVALCSLPMILVGQEQQAPARRLEAAALAAEAEHREEHVRELIARLTDPNLELRTTAAEQLVEVGLPAARGVPIYIENLRNTSPEVQQIVIRALGGYGMKASAATPGLIRLLEDSGAAGFVREESARSLTKIGAQLSDVVASMGRVISNANTVFSIRLTVVEALGQIGSAAQADIVPIEQLLGDPATPLRCTAFSVLGRIQGPALSAVSIQSVAQLPPKQSSRAFAVLQRQPAQASADLPALVSLAGQTTNTYLRCAAIETLGLVKPARRNSVEVLLRAVGDPDDYISQLAVHALETAGTVDPSSVAVLASSLHDPQVRIRIEAARALGRTAAGVQAVDITPAVPALVDALVRSDNQTSYEEIDSYLDALSAMGGRGASAANVLVAALGPASKILSGRGAFYVSYLGAHFLVTLGDIKAPTAVALPLALRALRGDDPYWFAAGAKLAGSMGPPAQDTLPLLIQALDPSRPDHYIMLSFLMHTSIKLEVIRALSRMGPAAAAAVPALEAISTSGAGLPYNQEAQAAMKAIRVSSP
jgi:HEAT repeat protein